MNHDHEPNVGGDCGQSADSADNLRTGIINDGGAAFPILRSDQPGMTLRDWFAGQALAGLCANPSIHQPNGMCGWSLVNCHTDDLARYALHLADAMIEARKGGAK